MNCSTRQFETISLQISMLPDDKKPKSIIFCDGFSLGNNQDYKKHFTTHKWRDLPVLVVETDPDMSIHPFLKWGLYLANKANVEFIAHIDRDDLPPAR